MRGKPSLVTAREESERCSSREVEVARFWSPCVVRNLTASPDLSQVLSNTSLSPSPTSKLRQVLYLFVEPPLSLELK